MMRLAGDYGAVALPEPATIGTEEKWLPKAPTVRRR